MNARNLSVRDVLSPHFVVAFAIIAVVAITFGVIVASLNRGFDWGDEGFVYAMIVSNHLSTTEFWGFQYLLNPLYELLGGSVLTFRILRLLGYVALGIVLTLLARATLRPMGVELGRVGWLLVAFVSQIGTFAAWSYPPRYLGYNELASWLTQIGAALLIFLLLEGRTVRDDRPARRWWVWLIVGIVLSALTVAKISSGIFLFVLATVAALLAVGGEARFKRAGGLLGGFFVGLLLMLASGVPLQSFFATIARAIMNTSAQAQSGYSINTLLETYLRSLSVTTGALVGPILLAGITLFVVRGFPAGPPSVKRVVTSAEKLTLFFAFALATSLILVDVRLDPAASWESLGVSNALLLVLALLSLALLTNPAAMSPNPTRRISPIALALALIVFALAPLTSSLGTNNPIFGQTVFSTTIWAVGAGVGLVLLWRRSSAISAAVRLLPVLLLGVIVAASGLRVAGEVFLHPYGTAPYFTQESMVGVGDLRGIRLTGGEAELYTWLHEAGIRQDAEDVPTLSIASPGALLAFNASGWSAIWPGPNWASSIAQSCADTVPEDLIVLQSSSQEAGSPGHDQLVKGLGNCDIAFPIDFKIVENHSSENPAHDVRVWRLS